MATDSNQRHTRLQKLSGSNYEIADGQPDIRGWDVKDEAGKQLGEVDELIFDEQSLKVRYLVLDLEDNELDLDDRDVLVPIGIAELHKDDDDVILRSVTADQLRSLPEYDEDRFDTSTEESVRNVFGGLGAGALAGGSDSDFYNHDHFNEDNLYRNRRSGVAAGETLTGDSETNQNRALILRSRRDDNSLTGQTENTLTGRSSFDDDEEETEDKEVRLREEEMMGVANDKVDETDDRLRTGLDRTTDDLNSDDERLRGSSNRNSE